MSDLVEGFHVLGRDEKAVPARLEDVFGSAAARGNDWDSQGHGLRNDVGKRLPPGRHHDGIGRRHVWEGIVEEARPAHGTLDSQPPRQAFQGYPARPVSDDH